MADPRDCPVCTVGKVNRVFSAPECANCGHTWPNYTAFRDMYLGRYKAPRPKAGTHAPLPAWAKPAVKIDEVEENYVTSGDMKKDIESVIETAAMDREFEVIKRIGHRVAEVAQASMEGGEPPKDTVDRILIYITQEVKDALKKQNGTWDE